MRYDKLKARELMASAGALKPRAKHTHTFDYLAYLGAEPPAGDDE